jgi:hypothetical protein
MGATIQAPKPAAAGASGQIMPSDALVFFGATGDLAYKKMAQFGFQGVDSAPPR